MKKPYNDTMKATPLSVWDSRITIDGGAWFESGLFHTPFGYAILYRQSGPSSKHRDTSNVDFIWKGQWYRRSWNMCFTKRGLSMLANRLVKDVVSGKFKKG